MFIRATPLLNSSPTRARCEYVVLLVSITLIGGHLLPSTKTTRVEAKHEASDAVSVPQLLVSFCGSCHTNGRSGLDLDVLVEQSTLSDDRRLWERVLRKLRTHQMPPPEVNTGQPTREERKRLMDWVEQGLALHVPDESGRPHLWTRLLQRREYQNAVRDLLNVHVELGQDYPADTPWRSSSGTPVLTGANLKQYQDSADAVLAKVNIAQFIEHGPFPNSAGRDSLGAVSTDCDERAELWDAEEAAERVQEILSSFADRAYRRPITNEEASELGAIFAIAANEGLGLEDSVKAALKAVLTSPDFLYRIERSEDFRDSNNGMKSFELASRLSFFLWTSIPDDELWDLAQRGTIRENLDAQVRRMLKNTKARGFGREFAAYWLKLDGRLETGDIDQRLLRAMREETERFVSHIVDEDRHVAELIDADYTFLNERLARHYGIDGVQGDEFRRVSTVGSQRGGLLTQASVLTLTSTISHTSIVLRGKWVLDNLLDSPPPPPPPGTIAEFATGSANSVPGSRRKLLEQHRTAVSCAKCHAPMDALGNALENFDHTGAWRTVEGPHPVDARGTLPTGESFDGPVELKAILRGKQALFARGLSSKLLSYSLGRKLRQSDNAAIEPISPSGADDQFRFSSIVVDVVKSDMFQRGR